jgi:hypothetical protein
MAYAPPPGNAVIFDGTGAAYAPPAGNAVIFDVSAGSSFAKTVDGTPVAQIKGMDGVAVAQVKTIG